MIGNALTPENRERVYQSRALLEALKDIKLRARAAKYEGQSADLWDLFGHLEGEVREAVEELNKQDTPYMALALEIADISNCCDLIIAELLEELTATVMTYYT